MVARFPVLLLCVIVISIEGCLLKASPEPAESPHVQALQVEIASQSRISNDHLEVLVELARLQLEELQSDHSPNEPTPAITPQNADENKVAEEPPEVDVEIWVATWCGPCHQLCDRLFPGTKLEFVDGKSHLLTVERNGQTWWFRVTCDDRVRTAPEVKIQTGDGWKRPNGPTIEDMHRNVWWTLDRHKRQPDLRYPKIEKPKLSA